MAGIKQFDGDNYGGFYRILIALRKDVIGLIPFNGIMAAPSQATVDDHFEEIVITRDTGSHVETEEYSAHGSYFNQRISFIIPKDRQDVRAKMMKYKDAEVVVLIQDNNLYLKLIGTDKFPLRLLRDFSTRNQVSERAGFNFNIGGNTKTESAFVTGINLGLQPADPAPTGVAYIRRNDGTLIATINAGQSFYISSPYSWSYNIV